MAKSYNQKIKILYLMKLFLERTDEQHAVTMAEILEYLAANGINAERKTIYDDLETLRLFGLDILYQKPTGYFLGSREFELAELKLLVDAVQASRFITERKSRELIRKLEGLTSHYEAGQLQRQVYVTDRIKTMNESIYYNVDKIHTAISGNVQITFQYFEWTASREMKLRKDGEKYKVSPWILSWSDENYYLLAYDEQAEMVKFYRVDKMLKLDLTAEPRQGKEHFEHFNLAEFSRKTFGMYAGEEEHVTLVCENRLIGVIIDRFGKEAAIRKADEEHFLITVKANVSGQFYGWLTGLGTGVRIQSPQKVAEEYQRHLEGILAQYKGICD